MAHYGSKELAQSFRTVRKNTSRRREMFRKTSTTFARRRIAEASKSCWPISR